MTSETARLQAIRFDLARARAMHSDDLPYFWEHVEFLLEQNARLEAERDDFEGCMTKLEQMNSRLLTVARNLVHNTSHENESKLYLKLTRLVDELDAQAGRP